MRSLTLAVALLPNLAATVSSQCTPVFTALGAPTTTFFFLFTDSVAFDPDGAGPLPPRIVCSGYNSNSTTTPNSLGVAAFDPATSTWSPLGTGVVNGYATRLAVLSNGDLVVGGLLSSIDGVPVNNIARWTGSAFAPLGSGVPGAVQAMAAAPNGDLVVAAGPSVWRWNGSNWTPFAPAPNPNRLSMRIAANNDVLVGADSGILRWSGSTWVAHAPGMDSVHNFALLPNGNLLGAGHLASQLWDQMNFAVWDGSTWTPLGPTWGYPFGMSFVSDVLVLPNGDPVVSGQFIFSGVTVGGLNRWNGTTWALVGGSAGSVRTASLTEDGAIFIGGGALGVYRTTCPASVTSAGTGCPGSGGANVLAVEQRAWLGSTFRSRGHGLPSLAIAAAAYGWSQLVLPLSVVFPQAQPGCNLRVAPDFVQLSITSNGEATSAIDVPSNPALLGLTFHHQFNLYEFDTGGNLIDVTASNAVTVTVGAF